MGSVDNKTLIERISADSGLSQEDVSKMLKALAGQIRENAVNGDSVSVPGFGTFEPRKRSERLNIHPATGKRMLLPPKIILSFKPSALLKQRLNPSE